MKGNEHFMRIKTNTRLSLSLALRVLYLDFATQAAERLLGAPALECRRPSPD